MYESHCNDGYVFGKELRNFYWIGLTFLAICMLAFSVMLWDASLKPGSSMAGCIAFSVMPISILVWIPISVKKYAWLIDMRFEYANNYVSNIARKETRYLHLEEQSCCMKLSIPFYWGKGKSDESFFLISETSISIQNLDGKGGLSVLKHIWEKTDAIILPANECILPWIFSHFEKIDVQFLLS